MIHDTSVLEMVNKSLKALDSSILNFADFFTIEFFPFLSMKFEVKSSDALSIKEIDKSISNIALVL